MVFWRRFLEFCWKLLHHFESLWKYFFSHFFKYSKNPCKNFKFVFLIWRVFSPVLRDDVRESPRELDEEVEPGNVVHIIVLPLHLLHCPPLQSCLLLRLRTWNSSRILRCYSVSIFVIKDKVSLDFHFLNCFFNRREVSWLNSKHHVVPVRPSSYLPCLLLFTSQRNSFRAMYNVSSVNFISNFS